jgi:hypothetical protein
MSLTVAQSSRIGGNPLCRGAKAIIDTEIFGIPRFTERRLRYGEGTRFGKWLERIS